MKSSLDTYPLTYEQIESEQPQVRMWRRIASKVNRRPAKCQPEQSM
jgi:hypothetical protein